MSKKTPHIYLISGLGADYRVFQKINLKGYNYTHIKWSTPKSQNQSIVDYTKSLLPQIKNENPILIGVSFGGMIAIEIAKLIPTTKVIVISTIKTKNELPLKYRLMGLVGLNKITPEWMLNKNSVFLELMFGIKSDEGKKVFREIIADTDTHFMKWAINQIVSWNNTTVPKNVIHIHGKKDKLLPVKLDKVQYVIENGGHFMIFEKAKKINKIINEVLCSL